MTATWRPVAVTPCGDREIGVARYIVVTDNTGCEFAVVIADAWQRRGAGALLVDALMEAARGRGLKRMFGDVLVTSQKMLNLTRRLGFQLSRHADDPRLVRVEAAL